MKVKVAFYGRLRGVAGASEAEVRMNGAEPTVAEVADRLREQRPELAEHMDGTAFAVDDRLVDPGYVVRPDDVIELLPPVSGG